MDASAKMDDDEGINEINVTPLVDVMLVLLVIFLVASIYIVKESIEVELPKAASAGETLDTTLSIVIDREGRTYLNGRPSSDEIIAKACSAAAAKDSNAQAIIAAVATVEPGPAPRKPKPTISMMMTAELRNSRCRLIVSWRVRRVPRQKQYSAASSPR